MDMFGPVALGAIVGLTDRALAGRVSAYAWTIAILMSVLGALLGAFLGRSSWFMAQGEVPSAILSVLGAVALVSLYRVGARGKAVRVNSAGPR